MAEIIAICGKICCGKTWYANELKTREKAVILSCDEVTKILFDNDLGAEHDRMAVRIQAYLKKEAVELAKAGCTVILDWGFWRKADRAALTEFCRERDVPCRWHYVCVDDAIWEQNIRERNSRIRRGEGGCDYYLDQGLLDKLLSLWEEPQKEDVDVWYELKRS